MDNPVETPSLDATSDESLDNAAVNTADEALVEEELLVEEISIDGMCGVY